ncbi:MAG TPA: hypothetical protein VKI62_04285 [Bacteroidota bacterium]|nr:hypothetical protein [Bacteroidota bacterium]
MQSREYFLSKIQQEISTARESVEVGNEGKARVCARRAAGWAIQWFVSRNARPDWRIDAMSQLRLLQGDESFSNDIRDAARRLSTRISDRFEYSPSADPIEDAIIIINEITRMLGRDADR